MISKEKLFIMESVNPITLLYTIFLNIFKKSDIYCLTYKPERYKRIYSYFKIKVIDIHHWDIAGIDIPAYLLDEFPELRIRINERAFLFTEKYSPLLFKNNKHLINKLINFIADENILVVLKRYLLSGFKKRIKSLEFSSIIIKYNKSDKVIFVPDYDWWDFLLKDEAYKSLNLKIPFMFYLTNKILSLFYFHVMFFLSSIYIVVIYLKRGIVFKNEIVEKNIAMPIVWGIGNKKQVNEEIFIDNNKLSLSNILFTNEYWDIDHDTRDYLSSHNVEIIEPKKIKVPLDYLFRRIIVDYYLKYIIGVFILNILKKERLLLFYSLRICKTIIHYEIFLKRYFFKVYITRDEYGPNSNIRSIVFNRNGIKTVGLPHGDYNHPFMQLVEAYSYTHLDEYFIWGKGYEPYFNITTKNIKKYTPVGIPRIHYIKESLNDKNEFIDILKEKQSEHKIVSVFTGYINEQFLRDKPQRLKENINYFNFVLNIYKEYKEKYNLYLVFKYKDRSLYNEISEDLKNILNLYKNDPDITVYGIEKNSYNLIAYSDIVISWGLTSTGLESIAVYKPVVYYDPYKSRYNIFRSLFGNRIVTWNETEFKEAVIEILSGERKPTDEMYDYIRREFCNVYNVHYKIDSRDLIKESIYKYLR